MKNEMTGLLRNLDLQPNAAKSCIALRSPKTESR
jgi:hypothetical protein